MIAHFFSSSFLSFFTFSAFQRSLANNFINSSSLIDLSQSNYALSIATGPHKIAVDFG